MPFWLLLIAAAGYALLVPSASVAEDRHYTDRELIDGFNLTVFGREDDRSGVNYVSKFIGPVSVGAVNSDPRTNRSGDVKRFVQMLDRLVPGLRIKPVADPERAQLVVYLVPRVAYRQTVSAAAPDAGKGRFLRENRCTAVMWTRTTGVLVRAAIFIVVDEGERHFQSCLAEELTQALGPANDNDRLPHSLYNDSNHVDVFGLFDWYILSAVYDPHMLAGMTPGEANAVLPKILAKLRAEAPVSQLPAP